MPRLLSYCWQAIRARFRSGATVWYYVPSPPKRNSLYRDWIVLLLVRPLSITEDVNMEASEQYVIEYASLWNYWDNNYMVVTRPGAVTIEKVVTLEIAIFSVTSEQVVWAGRMKTTNPKSLREFLDEMVEMGSKELKKQGLIS